MEISPNFVAFSEFMNFNFIIWYIVSGDTAMMMDNSPIFGNKEICVLEIDDTEDADILDSILDRFPPPGVQVFSTEG